MSAPRPYAADTSVSVEKSRAEIEKMLTRYGASSFVSGLNPSEAVIAFTMKDRNVMFSLPLPHQDEQRFRFAGRRLRTKTNQMAAWEQACRSRWRALALAIKAKLEAVEIGITTFEEEFLAHIMMPDGQTVGQHVRPRIQATYEGGHVGPLLGFNPGPKE